MTNTYKFCIDCYNIGESCLNFDVDQIIIEKEIFEKAIGLNPLAQRSFFKLTGYLELFYDFNYISWDNIVFAYPITPNHPRIVIIDFLIRIDNKPAYTCWKKHRNTPCWIVDSSTQIDRPWFSDRPPRLNQCKMKQREHKSSVKMKGMKKRYQKFMKFELQQIR